MMGTSASRGGIPQRPGMPPPPMMVPMGLEGPVRGICKFLGLLFLDANN